MLHLQLVHVALEMLQRRARQEQADPLARTSARGREVQSGSGGCGGGGSFLDERRG